MDERNTKTAEALKTLQYDSSWLEWGILNEEFLHAQLEQLSESDDKNSEHYRYVAFRAALSGEGDISDELIESYITLARLDEDEGMARAALVDLIRSPRLTATQFQGIGRHAAFTDSELTKLHTRQALLRELKAATAVTDSLFELVLSNGDSVMQRVLIDKHELSKERLEALNGRGANRAIKNIAKQLLQRRRI
jgi:hypothetical protein